MTNILLLIFIAVLAVLSLINPVLAWHVLVYVFCAVVLNGILFIVLLMNGVSHSGTGWTKTADIIHYTTQVVFVVLNIWWAWFVFF